MKRTLFFFVVLIFVTGCGGGDVVTTDMSEPEEVENIADPEPEPEERFDCFKTDEKTLRAFLEDLNKPLSESDKAAQKKFLESLGSPVSEIRDSDRERLGNLTDVLCDGRVNRWEQSPVIRIGASPEDEREALGEMIEQINKSLPYEFRIKFEEDVLPNSPRIQPPDGEIWVDIAPKEEWRGFDTRNFIYDGAARFSFTPYRQYPVRWGRTWSTIVEKRYEGDKQHIATTIHELWHVLLGHHCHAAAGVKINGGFKWKIFTAGTTDNQDKISRLELDTLRALYLHMEPGDYADTLKIPEEEMCEN